MGHIVNGISRADRPLITHDEDCRYITGVRDGTVIGYKYFALSGKKIRVAPLYFHYTGKGRLDFKEFSLSEV